MKRSIQSLSGASAGLDGLARARMGAKLTGAPFLVRSAGAS
jgi:hypothetical protein